MLAAVPSCTRGSKKSRLLKETTNETDFGPVLDGSEESYTRASNGWDDAVWRPAMQLNLPKIRLSRREWILLGFTALAYPLWLGSGRLFIRKLDADSRNTRQELRKSGFFDGRIPLGTRNQTNSYTYFAWTANDINRRAVGGRGRDGLYLGDGKWRRSLYKVLDGKGQQADWSNLQKMRSTYGDVLGQVRKYAGLPFYVGAEGNGVKPTIDEVKIATLFTAEALLAEREGGQTLASDGIKLAELANASGKSGLMIEIPGQVKIGELALAMGSYLLQKKHDRTGASAIAEKLQSASFTRSLKTEVLSQDVAETLDPATSDVKRWLGFPAPIDEEKDIFMIQKIKRAEAGKFLISLMHAIDDEPAHLEANMATLKAHTDEEQQSSAWGHDNVVVMAEKYPPIYKEVLNLNAQLAAFRDATKSAH